MFTYLNRPRCKFAYKAGLKMTKLDFFVTLRTYLIHLEIGSVGDGYGYQTKMDTENCLYTI